MDPLRESCRIMKPPAGVNPHRWCAVSSHHVENGCDQPVWRSSPEAVSYVSRRAVHDMRFQHFPSPPGLLKVRSIIGPETSRVISWGAETLGPLWLSSPLPSVPALVECLDRTESSSARRLLSASTETKGSPKE